METLNQRIAAALTLLKGEPEKVEADGLQSLPADLRAELVAMDDEHDRECWGEYLTNYFAAGGLFTNFGQWARRDWDVASPTNTAFMLDNEGALPVYEVTVHDVVYRYDHDAVFMAVSEDPDGQEEFWFFHRLNGPTAEQITDLIVKAKGE